MALFQERPFERHLIDTGACLTTCMRCHAVAGTAFWEIELDELEARHICKVEFINASALALPVEKPVKGEPFADHAARRRYA